MLLLAETSTIRLPNTLPSRTMTAVEMMFNAILVATCGDALKGMIKLLRESSPPLTLVQNPLLLKTAALQTQLFKNPGKDQMHKTTSQLLQAAAAADKLREYDISIDPGVLGEGEVILAQAKVCIAVDFALEKILRAKSGPEKLGTAQLATLAADIERALKKKGCGKHFELPLYLRKLLQSMQDAGHKAAAAGDESKGVNK